MKIWVFAESIKTSLRGLYDKAIAANLKMKFRHYATGLRDRYREELCINLDEEIEKVKVSTDLDHITAKAFGFKDA